MTTTALTKEARAAYGFVERNFNLVKRYWGWELVWLTYSTMNALAITYIGAGMEKITGVAVDTSYLILYLLVGTLVWHYLSLIFELISEMIAWERWEGTIEYTFMAPVSRFTHFMGTTVFSLSYGLLHTLVIMGVVVLFFRIDLSGANLPGAMLILISGSLSFMGLGIVAAVLPLLYPEKGSQMTHAVQAVFLLISGVYFPTSVLPGWMQPLARLSPGTHVLEGMRGALLAGSSTGEVIGVALRLVVVGLLAVPAGIYLFSRAERYAKRAGKLSRDG